MYRLVVALFFISTVVGEVHVLLTSALISEHTQLRKQEYEEGVKAINHYGFTPHIVVSNQQQETFLSALSPSIYFTGVQRRLFRNKGVYEMLSILKAIDSLPFDDEDMVVKVTGRYLLEDTTIFDAIEKHPDSDAIVRLNRPLDKEITDECDFAELTNGHHIFTGCFALRWKVYKQILRETRYYKMELNMINTEDIMWEGICKHISPSSIVILDRIGMVCRIHGDGTMLDEFVQK